MPDSDARPAFTVAPAGPGEAPLALETAAAAEAADGHPPFSDQTRALLRRGGHERLLVVRGEDEAGPLAGAAAVLAEGDDLVVELVVHPRHRRRGVGTALAAAVVETVESLGERPVLAWAHGTLPGADRLAQEHGLRPVRELRRMRLDLEAADGLSDVALGDGVRVRGFRPGADDEAWLALNAEAFADHPEQGSLTQADLDARRAEDWFDADGLLLAEREADGALLGYHWTKHPRHPQDGPEASASSPETASAERGPEGEVYAVGVSPAARGTGLGAALTVAGLRRMLEHGARRILLYVDADNTAAVRLYERFGFVLDAADTQYRLR